MTTFLTVDGILSGGERGLLSMAFAPDYETSGASTSTTPMTRAAT